jgi:PPP family 3-phenylpropionic acid transporter
VILLSLSAIGFLLLPFSLNTGNGLLVFVNMVLITVTGMPVGGLLDAWIVGLKQEYTSLNYGLIRSGGSVSFAISAQIAGTITVLYGHDARLWIGGGFFALAALLALTFRSAQRTRNAGGEGKPAMRLGGAEALKLVFSSKQYNLLLGVSFLLMLSNSSMVMLMQLLIRDFGGSTAHVGTANAVMAVSEVPLMLFTAYFLKKLGFKNLFILCSAFYAIRMVITMSIGTVDGLTYLQLMQGLTYALLVPLSMSYLSKIVDERVRSTAVTTYTAITASFSGILGNIVTTTFLTMGYSAQNALIFFAFSAFLGFCLTLYGSVRKVW